MGRGRSITLAHTSHPLIFAGHPHVTSSTNQRSGGLPWEEWPPRGKHFHFVAYIPVLLDWWLPDPPYPPPKLILTFLSSTASKTLKVYDELADIKDAAYIAQHFSSDFSQLSIKTAQTLQWRPTAHIPTHLLHSNVLTRHGVVDCPTCSRLWSSLQFN